MPMIGVNEEELKRDRERLMNFRIFLMLIITL